MNYPLAEAILSYTAGRRLDMGLVRQAEELGRHVHPIEAPEFGRWLEAVMRTYPPEVTRRQLNLLDSHDTPRFISMAGGDPAALRLATLVQMTLPGAPCIYYGDEVGLSGGHDPDCRRGYPWDASRQDRGMRAFVGGLIALRASEPPLRRGRFELLGAEGPAVAYRLVGEDDGGGSPARSILVAVNAGERPATLRVTIPEHAPLHARPLTWLGSEWLLPALPDATVTGTLTLELAARQGAVVELAPAV